MSETITNHPLTLQAVLLRQSYELRSNFERLGEKPLLRDKDLILSMLQCNLTIEEKHYIFKFIAPELKRDYQFILAVIEQDYHMLAVAPEKFRAHPDIVWAAIQQNGLALGYTHPICQANPNIVKEAVRKAPGAFRFADLDFHEDPEFILNLVKENSAVLGYVTNPNLEDRELLLAFAQEYGATMHSDHILRRIKDPEIMSVIIKQCPEAIKHISPEIKAILDITPELEESPKNSDQLPSERESILKAIKQRGGYLVFHANPAWQADQEMIQASVEKYGYCGLLRQAQEENSRNPNCEPIIQAIQAFIDTGVSPRSQKKPNQTLLFSPSTSRDENIVEHEPEAPESETPQSKTKMKCTARLLKIFSCHREESSLNLLRLRH